MTAAYPFESRHGGQSIARPDKYELEESPAALRPLPGDTEAYLARVESYIGWNGKPDPRWGASDVLASKRVIRALIEERDKALAALAEIARAGVKFDAKGTHSARVVEIAREALDA